MLKIVREKRLLAALLSVGCAGLVAALFALGALEGLELKTLDFRSRHWRPAHGASKDVVLVAIDEKSLDAFKKNGIVWKWPRDFYGVLVRYLKASGAKVIVFDELFADPDIDRKGTDGEVTDGEFAAAMREAGNVVLGAQFLEEKNLKTRDNAPVVPGSSDAAAAAVPGAAKSYVDAVLPIESFQKSAAFVGATNYDEDKDGIFRRARPFYLYRGHAFTNIAMAAFQVARKVDKFQLAPDGRLLAGDAAIPLGTRGRFLVRWYGPGGPNGVFRYYSFSDVLLSWQRGQRPAKAGAAQASLPAPPSAFKDKVVIVGASAPGLFDFRSTPFTTLEPYPGMEIHATIVSNLLENDVVRRAPSWAPLAAVLAFSTLVCCLFLFGAGMQGVLLATGLCALAWSILAAALFAARGVWLDLVAPLIALAMAFAAAAAASYQIEGKARRQLRTMFSRYLSPVVIKEVLEKSDTVELGGQDLVATAFFSDIKDFTGTSEKLTPQELVAFLNEYFSLTTEIVLRHKGMLDKYIGDAIMAIFGAPLPLKDHAILACSAALEIQRILERPPSGPGPQKSWKTRIGMTSGPMVVGNVGSADRLGYTAIGDTVNLASRLEGANKGYGTSIMISETTRREIGEAFETRELDLLAVKGKKNALLVYELLGKFGEVPAPALELKRRFEDGVHWYRERAFEKALSAFESSLAVKPEDAAARLYLDRCREYLQHPPATDWDGVYHATTK